MLCGHVCWNGDGVVLGCLVERGCSGIFWGNGVGKNVCGRWIDR